jgi:hypothetical protein
MTMAAALGQFAKVLKDVRELEGLLVKGVLAVPLVGAWVKLGPPPPTTTGILTSIAEALAIIWAFHVASSLESPALRRRFRASLVLFALGITVSISLLLLFTDSLPGRDTKIIEGFSLRDDVAKLITPSYTVYDALRDSEYDPYQVWNKWSVVFMTVALYSIWTFTFCTLATGLTLFAVQRGKRRE